MAKIASDTLDKEKRPLRLAIDVAIWQYQTMSGKGKHCVLACC